MGLRFFDIRVGDDVQRLIEPACMPSLVYVWRPEKSGFKPAIGEYVIARMPNSGFSVGAHEGDRIVKKVAAGPGDKVLIQGTELWINDKHADRLWLANSLEGKKAGDFDTRLELEEGQYFLMGTTKESFDSRYWGIVQSESIVGRALPFCSSLLAGANAQDTGDKRTPWADRAQDALETRPIEKQAPKSLSDFQFGSARGFESSQWVKDVADTARQRAIGGQEPAAADYDIQVFISAGMPEGVLRHLFAQAVELPPGRVRFVIRGFTPPL